MILTISLNKMKDVMVLYYLKRLDKYWMFSKVFSGSLFAFIKWTLYKPKAFEEVERHSKFVKGDLEPIDDLDEHHDDSSDQ